jgi:hypothetical protein
MAGRRGGRRAAGLNETDREEPAGAGILHSPPNAPVPPPPPPINVVIPPQASPPPMYQEVVGRGNANAPIPAGVELIPALLRQMMEQMQRQETRMINALRDLQENRPAANAPVFRPGNILPPAPNELPNIGRQNANPVAGYPPPNLGNANPTQHLKTSDAKIPQYCGASDSKTPYDFIIELEKYREVVGYTEAHMLRYVIPLALTNDAFIWYRYEPPFASWDEFKLRIREEFQAIGYHEDMRRDLQLRSQGPTEPLTEFIRVIRSYYERIGDPATELQIVNRILRNMHPEYKQAFLGKRIYTLDQLKHEARNAQELIKSMRTYKPPSVSGSLEPSLAWKPVAPVREVQKDSSTMALETGKTSHKLHMASVDPYAYHHPAGKKHVTVQEESPPEQTAPLSRGRSPTRRPNTPLSPNRNSSGTNSRNSSAERSPNRGCYSCGKMGHFQRDCPNSNSQSHSENRQASSPKRQ